MPQGDDELSDLLGLEKKKSANRRTALYAGLVVLAVGVILVLLSGRPSDRSAHYETIAAKRMDIEATVTATGSVEPTNLVEISSELSGTVKSVSVDFNDTVDVGTELAALTTDKLEAQVKLKTASIASAKAALAAAEATAKEKRKLYEMGIELRNKGVESEQGHITQEANYERAKADVVSAQAALERAVADLDLMLADLEKARIVSPIKGVVLDRAIDPGQTVAASFSAPVLFTIAEDLSRMELHVDVDEADIGLVHIGDPAQFTVEAYSDRSFPAEIREIRFAPETIDGVVTYKAVLSVDNSDLLIRPGMTATAEILVAKVPGALAVPNAALRFTPALAPEDAGPAPQREGLMGLLLPARPPVGNGGSRRSSAAKTVFVLRNGKPVPIPVETGDSDGKWTAIRSGDLQEGDLAITGQVDG